MGGRLFTGPRMPRDLLDKMGVPQSRPERRPNGAHRGPPPDRKERRKMERDERSGPHTSRRVYNSASSKSGSVDSSRASQRQPGRPHREAHRDDSSDGSDGVDGTSTHDGSDAFAEFSEDSEMEEDTQMKGAKRQRGETVEESAPRKKSRKEAEDDAEIAALQKKLGIKSKKLPKSFDDGLGDILGDLDEGSDASGDGGEYEAWLRQKRQKRPKSAVPQEAGSGDDEDLVRDSSGDESGTDEDDFGLDEDDDLDDDGGVPEKPEPRKRENPYVAPVTSNPTARYVPPSMRQEAASDVEAQMRLRRQIKGQLNRLSEANIISILSEIEKLYASNPRQYVTSGLIDLLIELTGDPAVLNDPFIILHAGFIAAVYRIIGPDFGAQFLDRFVQRFDACYKSMTEDNENNKSATNLVSLLSQLYNLQVISSILVFDYLRVFLSSISEHHTELLLRVVRSSGHQLRQDDPSALKDIAAILQKNIARASENSISVRTRFMVETITSLKDNKLKQSAATSALMAEHLTRMRKNLGVMNSRSLRATEPLSISLHDLHDADKRGKWWLVGASWKGAAAQPSDAPSKPEYDDKDDAEFVLDDAEDEAEAEMDLSALAKAHKMTTPLRTRIFSALLGAHDFRDAATRLRRLGLTARQRLDVPAVLLHCAAVEPAYNPFWGLVASRLCAERAVAKAFVFAGFGLFRRMGVEGAGEMDEAEEDEPKMQLREVLNLAKLYADLLADGAVSITLLKHLDLPTLPRKSRARTFVEVLLVTTIVKIVNRKQAGSREKTEEELSAVLGLDRNEEGFALGLRWFLQKVVEKSDLVAGTDQARVQKACKMLVRRMAGGDVRP